MLPLAFIICWFFYQKLKGLDERGNFEHLWAGLYSTAIFFTLLHHPSVQVFYYLGRPLSLASNTNVSTFITLSWISSLIVSVLLGVLFYYTVRLPGFMTGGRMFGLLIALPGMFINGLAAHILISILS